MEGGKKGVQVFEKRREGSRDGWDPFRLRFNLVEEIKTQFSWWQQIDDCYAEDVAHAPAKK